MESLSKRYEDICNEYLDLFCKKHDVYHTYWVGGIVGGIIDISDAFFNFDDNRLDIDLDAKKEEKNSIWDWYWSNIDSEQQINYYSYLKGLRIKNING